MSATAVIAGAVQLAFQAKREDEQPAHVNKFRAHLSYMKRALHYLIELAPSDGIELGFMPRNRTPKFGTFFWRATSFLLMSVRPTGCRRIYGFWNGLRTFTISSRTGPRLNNSAITFPCAVSRNPEYSPKRLSDRDGECILYATNIPTGASLLKPGGQFLEEFDNSEAIFIQYAGNPHRDAHPGRKRVSRDRISQFRRHQDRCAGR